MIRSGGRFVILFQIEQGAWGEEERLGETCQGLENLAESVKETERLGEEEMVRLGETCQGLEDLPARRSMRRRGRVCEGMKDVEVEELMSNVRCQMFTL